MPQLQTSSRTSDRVSQRSAITADRWEPGPIGREQRVHGDGAGAYQARATLIQIKAAIGGYP